MDKVPQLNGKSYYLIWPYWKLLAGKPYLHILLKEQLTGDFVYFPIIEENKVSFECDEKKICIGYPDENDRIISCDEERRIKKGFQCWQCMHRDKLLKCVSCKGTECVNKKAREYCQNNKHILYLALYTNDFIKVGTTNADRASTRLLEQGAKEAIIVAKFNSQMEAKFYENKISKELGIPERTNKKVQISAIKCDVNSGEKFLRKVSDIFPELKYLGNHINLYRDKLSGHNFVECNTEGKLRVSGTIKHIQGKYLLIDDKLINFRKLIRRRISFFEEVFVQEKIQKSISDVKMLATTSSQRLEAFSP
jgi:hypothetical protein